MHADPIARQRVIDHGEVFTPPGLVNDMLDLVADECERLDSRFLEPACGTGNFLIEVLERKLRKVHQNNRRNPRRWERDAILAVCSLYGIDLLADNVEACRRRLLGVVEANYKQRFKRPLSEPVSAAAAYILSQNIVRGDALRMRTPDHQPIVLPEWSPLNGKLLKRRDYAYPDLLGEDAFALSWHASDTGDNVFLPKPVGEYPPFPYLNVAQQAEARR